MGKKLWEMLEENKEANDQEIERINKKASADFERASRQESIWDKVNYIKDSFNIGMYKGTTGIAQGFMTDSANQMQKSKNKNKFELFNDFINAYTGNSLQHIAKSTLNTVSEGMDIINDKDKNLWQKAVDLNLNAISNGAKAFTPGHGIYTATNQLLGKYTDTDKQLLELNDKIQKPIDAEQERLAKESEKYDGVTNFLGTSAGVIGNMVPSITASALTKNPNVGLASMGLSVKGQATQEALDKGMDIDKATQIGDAKALIEVATEKLSGGTKIFGKGSVDDIAEELVKKGAKSKFGRFLLTQVANMGGEIAEEEISDLLGNAIDKGTTDPDKKVVDLKQALETAGSTAFTTTMLNLLTGGMIGDYKKISNDMNQYKDANTGEVLNDNSQNALHQAEDIINKNRTQNLVPNQTQNEQILPTQQITPQENQMAQNGNMEQTNNQKLIEQLNKNGNFSEQVDKYVSGKLKSSDTLYLGNTPDIIQKLGISDNPITMNQSKLRKLLTESNSNTDNLHGLSKEIVKRIPESISNPLNILKSSTQDNSIVIITDLADKNERPILASIKIDNKGRIGDIDFLSNKLTSAYGKNNYDRFMQTEIEKGNLLYDIDEGIIKELPTSTRLQLPEGISSFDETSSIINNSIPQNETNVKSDTDINNNYAQSTQNNTENKSFEDVAFEAMDNYENDEEVKSPLQNRNIDTIGKETKTNAYQYDNPKVKPYFQEMAQMIGEDLGYISSSDNRSTQKGGGTKLSATTKAIDILHNEQGYSYNQIAKGLQNIIEDNGQENNAISKKIELIIDDQLRNGYTNVLGQAISPNQEYIDIISNQEKTTQPVAPIKNTPGETVNWNEIEKPEGKIRKHYKSIIESSNTTAEAKAVAKELMSTDTYVPESNKSQIQRADNFIEKYGVEKALDKLITDVDNDTVSYDKVFKKVGVDDIALGERLIQYYSKTGDAVNLQNAIQATAVAGTYAGRAVQALSMLNHQTPTGQVLWIQRSVDKINQELINKRGENAPQFNFTSEMQQEILEAKTQEDMYKAIDKVYEELGQQVHKSRLEQIDSWRYFSMLANPKTHIRNIVGNVAMGGMQSVKNKVAGAIEGTVAQFNPEMERTHTLKPASKEVKQFAKNDIKNVADRLELNENKYNPKSRLENNMRTFKSDIMENTLGKTFDKAEKALEVEDSWGLKSGYVKALSEYMTANNLSPDTITDEQLSKARNYAIAEAKEATFHAENAIATAINQFSRKNKLTKGITDAVLPFVKTPMNVAKAGMEYNPTGLIKALTYDTVQLRKGNITVNKYIDNISKGLTGTGVAVLGYALAEAGILKASGEDDEKKEKFDEALGKQAYSIQIGDKTYSLDWLAPAGIPLFVGAEAHNISKAEKNEKTSKSTDDDKKSKQILESLENWANAMSNSMSPMAEMSMISGLTSALKSYDQDSTKMLGQIGTNSVKSYVNQFIPTALGQVARTSDKYERSTTSTKSGMVSKAIDQTKLQAMSKIPGLRQRLPVKTDVWGKEQEQEGNVVEKALKNAVLPFTIKSVNNTKVDNELNELYNKTGASSILPTTSLEKTFKIDKQDYRMTNEEYNKYKKDYGQISYNLLDKLVTSSEYKKLTNEQKQKAIESVYSYAKEKNKNDYADKNKLKVEPSTIYNTMEDLKKNNGNQSDYLNYIAKTTGVEKESERNKILSDSNYNEKTKSIIYKNGTGKDDDFYNLVANNTDLNIDEYLNYKIQNSEKAFSADKDKNGNSISGSAKKKVFSWVNENITGYENRLMLLANSYKLSNKERNDLTNYINQKSKNEEEAIEAFKKLSSNYKYINGKIYYK